MSRKVSCDQFSRRWLFASLLGSTLACMQTGRPAEENLETSIIKSSPLVILLAIDGVRWQDVFLGPEAARAPELAKASTAHVTPHLAKLLHTSAVYGAPGSAPFKASGPNFVSLPGYMEMLSGSKKLPCTENDCTRISQPTLIDDFSSSFFRDKTKAAVFSSWDRIISSASFSEDSGVISAGRFEGQHLEVLEQWAETQELMSLSRSAEGGQANFRFDRVTAQLSLAYLDNAKPDFLFLALGETDEAAHQGSYRDYLSALNYCDSVIGQLNRRLKVAAHEGRQTLFFITTDHGRAQHFTDHGRAHPESADSFLIARGSLVTRVGQLMQRPACLADIAPTIRAMCGLTPNLGAHQGRVLSELFS